MSSNSYEQVISEAQDLVRTKAANQREYLDMKHREEDLWVQADHARKDALRAVFDSHCDFIMTNAHLPEAVEAIFRIEGRDTRTAQRMAGYLGALTNDATESTPQAVYVSVDDVLSPPRTIDVIGGDNASWSDGLYLRKMYRSKLSSKDFRQGVSLVVPRNLREFYLTKRFEDLWYAKTGSTCVNDEVHVDLADVSIFNDPEEAKAFEDKRDYKQVCVVVGTEAVIQMVELVQGQNSNQNVIGLKSLLSARTQNLQAPDVSSIDVQQAVQDGLFERLKWNFPRTPANAHPDILNQVPQDKLFECVHAALITFGEEDLRVGSSISKLRVTRKLDKDLDDIVGTALSGFNNKLEDPVDLNDEHIQRAIPVVKRVFAQFIKTEMPKSSQYQYAMTPLARRSMRRRVQKILEKTA